MDAPLPPFVRTYLPACTLVGLAAVRCVVLLLLLYSLSRARRLRCRPVPYYEEQWPRRVVVTAESIQIGGGGCGSAAAAAACIHCTTKREIPPPPSRNPRK